MAGKSFSRRAEILERVLDRFNHGLYWEINDYLIFGGTADQVVFFGQDDEDPDTFRIEFKSQVSDPQLANFKEVMEFLNRVKAGFDKFQGRRAALERTSLGERPEWTAETALRAIQVEFPKLSPQAQAYFRQIVEKASPDAMEAHWKIRFLG